jgi:hypothetical protein
VRARGAWLWSRRRGVIAGFTAAALHGSKWVDTARPIDIIHDNRHPQPGIQVWGDRLERDEFDLTDGVPVTTAARTALDVACWYPTTTAVAAIDALARATELKIADVELLAARYRGAVGLSMLACRSTSSTPARNLRRRPGCDWSSWTRVCLDRRHRFR